MRGGVRETDSEVESYLKREREKISEREINKWWGGRGRRQRS